MNRTPQPPASGIPNVVLRTHGLGRDYRMGSETLSALVDVNLVVERNEYLAIVGASGSGKTTLMNILGCLDTPTHGEYWLNGTDVSHLSDRELARVRNREIGFVFQTFNLLGRATALRNVEVPLLYAGVPMRERRLRAMAALEHVGLKDRMRHKPNELSGGQRQRVAIARALVNRPALLLADEPTGNLDSRTGEEVLGLFRELYESGQTIVVVTHDPGIAARMNRRIELHDGRVVSDDGASAREIHTRGDEQAMTAAEARS